MRPSAVEKKFVRLSYGDIAYLERGAPDKPPVLLVHGIPTSSFLWRHVMRFMQGDFHCYAPDLMGLGDTVVDPRTGRFHMEAQAEMLLELMATLGHERFGLVCHDQGGAAAQIIVARQPERVQAFVITDCVAYDNWPVPTIRLLQGLARVPLVSDVLVRSGLVEWLETSTPLSSFRRGVYRGDRLEAGAIREYLRPTRGDRRAREGFKRFLLAGGSRYTETAVEGLRRFTGPTLVLWAADDRYLSPSWGRKLFEEIPGCKRFELVPFCGHFWQEERPAEFLAYMGEFLAEHMLAVATETEAETKSEAEPKVKPSKRKPRKRRANGSSRAAAVTGGE